MKEIFLNVINQIFGGDFITVLAIFIVGWITKTPVGIVNFIKRKSGKVKDVLPDNIENILVKLWDRVEPFAELLYKKVLEKLAQEMLKEVNGEETNLSIGLRSTMRDIKIALEEKVKSELKENIEDKAKEKAVELAKVVSLDLLEQAKNEIVSAEAMPKVNSFTLNDQTISIIDKIKDLPNNKNHLYGVYARLNKVEDKPLEAQVGASVGGRF